MNNNAKNEILNSINYMNSKLIKESEDSVWEAIKYLKGYDTIENNNLEEKEISEESFINSPWISLYYFDPVINVNDEIIVPFYVSNHNQDEWINDDYTTMFQIEIIFNNTTIRKVVHAGDNEINIGRCSEFGECYFTYQCTDLTTNIKSPLYVKHLLCKNKTKKLNIYEMIENDLITYNIDNTDNREITVMENNIDGLNSFIANKKSEGYDGVKLLPGQYNVAPGNTRSRAIIVPTNFTLDLNTSKIKHVFTTKGAASLVIKIEKDAIDSHIINGSIEGDYDEHDVTVVGDEASAGSGIEGEGFNVISMGGAFCSLENLSIGWATGYCTCAGNNSESVTVAQNFSKYSNSYIDLNGQEKLNSNFYTSDFFDLTTIKNNNYKFITACNYLGYGGYVGDSEVSYLHFYNENKEYLKSIKIRQYSLIPIIENVSYVKVTLYSTIVPTSSTFKIQGRNYVGMSNYKLLNIDFHDTRTCALATGIYDFQLVKNCTFKKCGQKLLTGSVTPVSIDLEDGYQWGQNYFFEDNYTDTDNRLCTADIIINYGYNTVIKNTNMGGECRYVKGLCIKDCIFESRVKLCFINKIKTGYHRVFNNTFKELSLPVEDSSMIRKIKKCVFVDMSTINRTEVPNGENNIFYNCVFNSMTTIGKCKIYNSKILNSPSKGITSILANIYETKIDNVLKLGGSPVIHKSLINNCTFTSEGHIYNSELIDSRVNYGYWANGYPFELNNCNIILNNSLALFSIPNYSLNKEINISGNNITLNDTSYLLQFYDDRINSQAEADYSAKYVIIQNNTITKNDKDLVTGIGTNNEIKIKYINNDIKDKQGNIFTPTQEVHDNVEITVE